MKGKSTTHEKFDLAQIQRFTEEQVNRLSESKKPFCLQVGDDVIVGKYRVSKINDYFWNFTGPDLDDIKFALRKSAILYGFAMHTGDHGSAFKIKEADKKLERLEFDAVLYRRGYNKALEEKDAFNIVHYSNRYSEVTHRISSTKNQLKEFLLRNKYIKG